MKYNCTILDLGNRKTLATRNSKSITSNLAVEILNKIIKKEQPDEGLYFIVIKEYKLHHQH